MSEKNQERNRVPRVAAFKEGGGGRTARSTEFAGLIVRMDLIERLKVERTRDFGTFQDKISSPGWPRRPANVRRGVRANRVVRGDPSA